MTSQKGAGQGARETPVAQVRDGGGQTRVVTGRHVEGSVSQTGSPSTVTTEVSDEQKEDRI